MKTLKNIDRFTNFKFILIFSVFLIFGQTSFAQYKNINEIKLTKAEKKLAKEKGLEKNEMKILTQKYSYEEIKNTPVSELRSSFKKVNISEEYKKCNEERKKLTEENRMLKAEISKLRKENKELKEKLPEK